jgi:hypothetical protein
MTVNDPTGQRLPDDGNDFVPPTRVQQIVKALDDNRYSVERWFWKGLLAFNLILGSVVFWFWVVPSML